MAFAVARARRPPRREPPGAAAHRRARLHAGGDDRERRGQRHPARLLRRGPGFTVHNRTLLAARRRRGAVRRARASRGRGGLAAARRCPRTSRRRRPRPPPASSSPTERSPSATRRADPRATGRSRWSSGVGSARGVTAGEVSRWSTRRSPTAGWPPRRCVPGDRRPQGRRAGHPRRSPRTRLGGAHHPAGALAAIDVPNPSEVVRAEVGTPSVAEAAALLRRGRAELVVAKRKSAMATVGRRPARARAGGCRSWASARRARPADSPCGRRAAAGVRRRRPGPVRRAGTRPDPPGHAGDRVRPRARRRSGRVRAVAEARRATRSRWSAPATRASTPWRARRWSSPARTSTSAACPASPPRWPPRTSSARPWATTTPTSRLSDLHTPWEVIERGCSRGAEGDFTVCFYNPRSRARDWQLPAALRSCARTARRRRRSGYVRNATRTARRDRHDARRAGPRTRGHDDRVVVGIEPQRTVAGRFVTPRGYQWA